MNISAKQIDETYHLSKRELRTWRNRGLPFNLEGKEYVYEEEPFLKFYHENILPTQTHQKTVNNDKELALNYAELKTKHEQEKLKLTEQKVLQVKKLTIPRSEISRILVSRALLFKEALYQIKNKVIIFDPSLESEIDDIIEDAISKMIDKGKEYTP